MGKWLNIFPRFIFWDFHQTAMASLRIFLVSIFFITLLVADWNIQILYLRKFLTENMKWILKKKNQQIHLQVNRNEMCWVFWFVSYFKASGNLCTLVFLHPLFAHKPNRRRGWGLYSAQTRLPNAVERLGFQRLWLSANQLHHTKLFPLFSASDEIYHVHLDLAQLQWWHYEFLVKEPKAWN